MAYVDGVTVAICRQKEKTTQEQNASLKGFRFKADIVVGTQFSMLKLNLMRHCRHRLESKDWGTDQSKAKEAVHFVNVVPRGRMLTAGPKIDIRQRTEI